MWGLQVRMKRGDHGFLPSKEREVTIKTLSVLAMLCFFSGAAVAQTPDVREEAKAWLSTVDAGNYAESWEQAGEYFQEAMSQAEWVEALNNVRAPLGESLNRVVTESTQHDSLPGVPDGQYMILLFDSQFEHLDPAIETLTLVNEEREWRVVGYFVRPGV